MCWKKIYANVAADSKTKRIQCTVSHCECWVCSHLFRCGAELRGAWLTMASGTMPTRSSCATRISVSASWVAARLAGYSTCQAIQRLPSGSGKLSTFRSTWSTLWTPISDLPEYRRKKKDRVSEWLGRWLDVSLIKQKWERRESSFNLLCSLITTKGKGLWMFL